MRGASASCTSGSTCPRRSARRIRLWAPPAPPNSAVDRVCLPGGLLRSEAARPPPPHPFANGWFADAEIGRDLRDRLSRLDMAGHLESTVGRGARILVNVHPELRPGLLTVGNHQFPSPAPGEQPSQQSQLEQQVEDAEGALPMLGLRVLQVRIE